MQLWQNLFFFLFKSGKWRETIEIFFPCTLPILENKKIWIFKVRVIFRTWKLAARALGQNCGFFGIELLKMVLPDRQKCVGFQKLEKVISHSNLYCAIISVGKLTVFLEMKNKYNWSAAINPISKIAKSAESLPPNMYTVH